MTDTMEARSSAMVPNKAPRPQRPDPLRLFLRIGLAVLIVALAGFGVLYFKDQFVAPAPSIVNQEIALAEAAVRQNPNNVPARVSLAQAYADSKRYDDAISQFDQILRVAPGHTDAILGKGLVLLTKGDLPGATAEYTKIVDASHGGEFAGADTRLQAALYYLGVIANKEGQPAKALEKLTKALEIEPTDSDAMYQVGMAQAALGKHNDAILTFKRALTFVPTGWCDPYAQLQSSYVALSQPEWASYAAAMGEFCGGKATQAKATLSGLASGPAGVDAMLALGLIAQVENDKPGAISWYQKVLARDPKNISAMSYLAALGVAPPGTAPSADPTPKK